MDYNKKKLVDVVNCGISVVSLRGGGSKWKYVIIEMVFIMKNWIKRLVGRLKIIIIIFKNFSGSISFGKMVKCIFLFFYWI